MVFFHSYVSLPEGIRIIHSCSCQIKYVLHAQTRMGDHFSGPKTNLAGKFVAGNSLRPPPNQIEVGTPQNKGIEFEQRFSAFEICYKYMIIYSFHVKFKRFLTKKMAQAIWPALHGWRRRIFSVPMKVQEPQLK